MAPLSWNNRVVLRALDAAPINRSIKPFRPTHPAASHHPGEPSKFPAAMSSAMPAASRSPADRPGAGICLATIVHHSYILGMCNDYEQHVRWVEYRSMMQALELRVPSHQSQLDLAEADDVRIADIGPVMRSAGNEIELVPMTFSFPPGRPRGAPVFNFRSEGRPRFSASRDGADNSTPPAVPA
jgi:hypothetical protein